MHRDYKFNLTIMADRKCGCSGIRKCLICEEISDKGREFVSSHLREVTESCLLHYCMDSKEISCGPWKSCSCSNGQLQNVPEVSDSSDCKAVHLDRAKNISSTVKRYIEACNELLGPQDIFVVENFVTSEEESFIQTEINKLPWKLSQSGRRKQDFGPQVNFKRRKLKVGNFSGFPFFLQNVVSKMKALINLNDFYPVEVCHLEYSSERGSAIDPHIDDRWLWGERLVTLSLLSSSILTLQNDELPNVEIQIPMPRHSLLILKGEARNQWKHSVKREDISNLRFAITFRELSEDFSSGDQSLIGKEVLKIADNFNGKPIFMDQK